MKVNYVFFLAVILSEIISFSQLGPGGVSLDFSGDSDCKMWVDAGELNLSDGASVSSWPDISLSANVNTPTQTNLASQPTYRSDLSASINGHPILRFLPAQYLQLLSSSDINTNGPYTARTTFLAFRTGSDVTTRQMLWEQGGTVRGLNIFIFNGELYFGGYDLQNDGDGTPVWNYAFTRVPLSPSTPYIITHVFDGPLGAVTGSISGFLNGQPFATVNPGPGNPATPVGSLWSHSNAPGLGAVNGDSYNELGAISGATGQQPFLGDMAEFIAYDEILNNAERIIVENYLGAKYFANLVVNDYFDHQVTHGTEVIGIGRDLNATSVHNTSQGRNLFQIQGNTPNFANANLEYFLIGHNQADISTWTVTNAPNNGINSLRLSREWKVDHTGDVGNISFQVDINDLPPLPSGYTKYCLIVDKSGGAVSDFNSLNTEVIEMVNTSGSLYSTSESIPDGAYVTLGIVDPMIQFLNSNDFGFELSPIGMDNTVSITIELNYRPAINVNVDYSFTDNTAIYGTGTPPGIDYVGVLPATGVISILNGTYTNQITFDILGDSDPEVTEDFLFTLFVAGNTTPGLDIGANATNTFTIFDDDNTPKVGFSTISSSHIENSGVVNVQILRTGNTAPVVSVDYQLRVIGGTGTSTNIVDYTYSSGTANFASGVTSVNMQITLIDDLLDEPNETVIFELINNSNCDILTGFKEHELTIIDNDSPPEIQFVVTGAQGPEALGTPSVEIQLSAPTSQVVQIDYADLGTGSATFAADYTIGTTGTITFIPGDTIQTLPLFIVNDAQEEADETINFSLNVGSAINCTPLGNLNHTFTIKDYSSFEWTGLAGVGQDVDNIMWLKASSLPNLDGANVQNFVDSSPNSNTISQSSLGNRPNMNFAGPNGQKELVFNGTSDVFDIPDDANINTAAFYLGKHLSIAFTTGTNVTSRQMLYEQGGGTRGISIYVEGGQLYYHIWSNSNDNGANSAWGVGSSTGAFFVGSGPGSLIANTNYIASFKYEVTFPNGLLTGYLNGENIGNVVISTPSGVEPRLYAHGDNGGLGGVIGSTRYHTNPSSATNFEGAIQELVHYSDAPVNESRRIIVENHLSTKYNINLFASSQYYSTPYALTNSYEMAGIGQYSSNDNHSDSRGTGMVRINNPSSLDNGDFLLWGHDNAALNIGLLPYEENIAGINNRLHRVWKASELGGDVGSVSITFYLNELPGFMGFNESDLVLLIDSDDGDFSNSSKIETGRTYSSITGGLTFSGVNLNHDVWFTIGSKSIITSLPIKLTSFNATVKVNEVQLDWVTATESNNDFFTIERSSNGIHWDAILKIDGAGNSNSSLIYSSIDKAPKKGLSYYRLSQTDFDGQTTHSQVRSVLFNKEDVYQVYPNPANNEVTIQFGEQTVSVNIFDIKGKVVISSGMASNSILTLNISALNKGMYLVQITNNEDIIIKQLIVE